MEHLFAFIFNMPGWLRITLPLLFILINYGAAFLVKRSILKVYRRTGSVVEAMNKWRIYRQYFLTTLQFITVIPLGFLGGVYFIPFERTGRIIFTLLVLFLFFIIINVGQLLILDKTYKRIRGTTESLSSQIRDIAFAFLFALVPLGVVRTISLFIRGINIRSGVLQGIIAAAIPIITAFLYILIFQALYRGLLKAVDLQDERLRELLNGLFDRAGIKRAKLYQWPTRQKKVANALVLGLAKPKVFISDYYLENAEPDEIEAIVAHEAGHLKQKHILKRLLYIVAGMYGVLMIGNLLDWYENYTGNEINPYLGLAILLVPFILYFSVGFLQFCRNQERKADEFALKIGIKPEVMITALLKVARLNHMALKQKKLDEKFQLHPSMARRIGRIEKISGYKYNLRS